ncbi:MAG: DUF6163 family protein [Pseudomonadota bacterium]
MEEKNERQTIQDKTDTLFRLFCKLIALVFILFSLAQWMKLTGFSDNSIRFDTMTSIAKISSVFLAIIQPIAALGLWSGLTWGLVVWAIAACGETALLLSYPELLGGSSTVIFFHLACAGVLIAYLVYTAYEKMREDLRNPG